MQKSFRFSFPFIHLLVQFDQVILNIRRILNSLRKHEYSSKYLETMYSKVSSNTSKNQTLMTDPKIILMDYFPIPHWVDINSMAARVIQERTGSSIAAFGFMKPFKNTKDLYGAFGVSNHLQIKLNLRQTAKMWKTYLRISAPIALPEDVFNLELNGIKIGIPIYESILRSGKVTVDTNDIETYKQIYRGLYQYIYFERLFVEDRIEAILVSHDCYIGPGLLDHMAHKFGVPSINVNPFEVNLPFEAGQLYKRFERYPIYFDSLPLKTRSKGVTQAKIDLDLRLSGKIGIKMEYQEQSAFETSKLPTQLARSDNLKVLVATHDFFDNPQAYGEMRFHDFSIWLNFLDRVASETSYDWYLKCHKDSSIQQRAEIQKFANEHTRFKVVEPTVSFHQLAEEGLDFVFSCYGSVGHELPLMGINVLNSSYNPHIAYDFNYHAESVENYKELILNLRELSLNEIPTSEIYEFFYIHHYLMSPDSFILASYSDYLKSINGNMQSDSAIEYLIENHEVINENLRRELLESLRERRVFSIESILEPEIQLKYPISGNRSSFFDKFSN